MKWLTVIDHGGIGDTLATAIALSAFRESGVKICYITRLWEDRSLIDCLGPYWDYLCAAAPHKSPTYDNLGLELLSRSDWVVNFTPFDPSGLGNFYTARIAMITKITGLRASEIDSFPIKRMGASIWHSTREMVLIHPFSAWSGKSIPRDESLALAERARAGGCVPVFVGAENQKSEIFSSYWSFWGRPMAEIVSLVASAKHCICADSCISHIAYWLRKPCHVFYRTTDASFLLGGMRTPPYIVRDGTLDVDKLWNEVSLDGANVSRDANFA